MTRMKKFLTRFWRAETGAAAVEFILILPAYMIMIFAALEVSFVTARHAMLERGLDVAVRELRLGTGTAPQHDEIKDIICENAIIIPNCSEVVRLEMKPTSLRNLSLFDQAFDCVDRAAESDPVRQFTPGQQNQLMLLRACAVYDPLFPTTRFSSALTARTDGEMQLTTMTAFVQEPN
ncbi:TadE/TadG family type IV pilus assembly protein [Roseovarius salinarum]|uniref:TadE/TadG family type IV pilus assembly protein n=1 Tax=Roseovarius salinarum TaxID=1981892 RepID=UPI000C344302|nr:TadE/TadG family type IV pilus assembly protein [Roseovarius salinarum]